MENLIAKRYAQALFGMKDISLSEVIDQLSMIADVINNSAETKEFLSSPLVSKAAKYDVVISAVEPDLDTKVISLLKLMAQRDRLILLPELVKLLKKEVMVESNHYIGTVETSEEITDALIEKLQKKLESFSGSKIELELEKSDIDGIKVEVSDLGLELNFSKESAKNALLEHIEKAL